MFFKLDAATFSAEIARLRSAFSPAKYPEERCKIIWDDIKKYDDLRWLRNLVDHSIKTMKDINWPEEISKKRDKFSHKEQSFSYSPARIEHSIFSAEEIKQHFQVMRAVMSGDISSDQAREYAACLRVALKEHGIKND